MPDERNRPEAFDDEPEVTYEPLPDEPRRKERGASPRWLAGGTVAGSVFGAGGSAIGNLRDSLDIFDSAGAAGGDSEVDAGQPDAEEITPIDFDSEDVSDAPGGSVVGLIHGAEAEAGGGFTLEEFEALDIPDPPEDFGSAGDLDLDDDPDDLDIE